MFVFSKSEVCLRTVKTCSFFWTMAAKYNRTQIPSKFEVQYFKIFEQRILI